ncbi:MAG: Zn-dependent hydrolase [Desulfobacterales bacterium C00003060]|nr:MAG: Zn-dependent hydrolase [Desulfobacterales bacterium S3730MH5]OEU77358.1 MAG: Zn-dependent hydrolase [Desulfobacterales bacterium C00003060]OEU83989.1 MAG: Zn-dependent hydrolase [Desulfobacterales bacterium S5133MH4]
MGVHDVVKNIAWLGHDGFLIKADGKVIVIDPFQVRECEPADILLVTHEHYDHCSPEDVRKIQKASTVIVTEADSAKKLSGDVRVVRPGDKLTVSGIPIEVVPAYNTNKEFHPKQNGWLGFILTVNGVRIYHAGDTDLIPEMENFQADIAMLPVSGTYVMTAEEAVEAAKVIKPKLVIPMHYGAIVGSADDARRFSDALTGICEVVML